MALQEGEVIYCLIKAHSITYLTEFDSQTSQRVLNHDNDLYHLGHLLSAKKTNAIQE
jgi:molybdate transport system ATP-binding protein